jgi:hypothetical protein
MKGVGEAPSPAYRRRLCMYSPAGRNNTSQSLPELHSFAARGYILAELFLLK